MTSNKYIIRFRTASELQGEYERNLRFGGLFIAETSCPAAGTHVEVVLVHPTSAARLAVEADVLPGAAVLGQPGFAVQLSDWDRDRREELVVFIRDGRVATRRLTADDLFGDPDEAD